MTHSATTTAGSARLMILDSSWPGCSPSPPHSEALPLASAPCSRCGYPSFSQDDDLGDLNGEDPDLH